eukprot:TRINITY_DN187_c0_g1_i14.p1 TRINITY_DN187_c0_g1~~TRINITY_DN187_c0_g1_i14.p1  ORF type:complete len:262 (-),score=45.09 TRINITY_DN187_c0_g1_i14:205-990(-)
MRTILFCLLLTVAFSQTPIFHYFRYKNGTFRLGDKPAVTITGSFHYVKQGSMEAIELFGMDYSTMTPVVFIALAQSTGITKEYTCTTAIWDLHNGGQMSGTAAVKGDWEKSELDADCISSVGEHWRFKTSNTKSPTIGYTQKEAGRRAKYLVGQRSQRFFPSHVVFFAVYDYPYFAVDCSIFLINQFPEAPGPEPGAIMAGNDAKHCGIVDDEGAKFIHSNPAAKKVTLDSIALSKRYFPNGVTYKRYPKEQNQKFLLDFL